MPDIDEVIEELESFDGSIIRNCPQGCPYEWVANLRSHILKLLEEQQAEIKHMKSEKTDAIEEIEREISVRERDPEYKTFSRGIVNGLEMALRIINEKGR